MSGNQLVFDSQDEREKVFVADGSLFAGTGLFMSSRYDFASFAATVSDEGQNPETAGGYDMAGYFGQDVRSYPSMKAIGLWRGDGGDNYYYGTSGPDDLAGDGGNDTIYGYDGDDTISGGEGHDYLGGMEGDDVIRGDAGDDLLDGGMGNNSLYGGEGDDYLTAYGGNDLLDGGQGADSLYGNGGDDIYVIDDRNDVIFEANAGDTAVVSVNGYSVPQGLTEVVYEENVEPLPYFIAALKSVNNPYWGRYGEAQTLTYSFALAATNEQNFQLYTAEQQAAVAGALGKYSAFSGLSFTEVADSPDVQIRFFRDDLSSAGMSAAAGYASLSQSTSTSLNSVSIPYFVMTTTSHESIHIDVNDFSSSDSMNPGTYGFQVLLHEIGHALGLKHPFEDGAVLPEDQDNTDYSVMSYTMRDYDLTEPAILDIAAMHYFFGVNGSALSGDDAYDFSDHYLWDGSGIDSFSAAAETGDVYLNLNAGSWLYAGLKDATDLFAAGQAFVGFGTTLENGEGGSGNDRLIGNGVNNQLSGIGGNDVLSGGSGDDTLDGGAGDDTALFSGAVGEYAVVYDPATGSYSVTDGVAGRDGVDTVLGVEHFSFDGVEELFPEIVLFSPANGAGGVAVDADIVITFSEAVTGGSGFIELRDSGGGLAESYDAVASTRLAFTGDTLTIDPGTDLEAGTAYSLVIPDGGILDLHGFAYTSSGDLYQFTTEESGSLVEGAVSFWQSGAALAGVELNLVSKPEETVEATASSNADGVFSFGRVDEGEYGLNAGKPVDDGASRAVGVSDALAAFKLAFGRNPNGDGEPEPTACQYLAADIDRNGSVEAADGLGILKMALGLSSAPEPDWIIAPESVADAEMSGDNVDWREAEIPGVALAEDVDLQLVGVLMGDVDGSWAA
ncbi:Ig-like domain-containing protein [Chlorobaculum sp. 24CR]|uniref:Ig-like domain-containing protein n=1 Tax=Chlorobaculum sp. 24CR TaxID=2508878 RepID=UPI00142FC819|nr:Ig-like domain-containing protein [Chlorobaculum sp. 24CR]